LFVIPQRSGGSAFVFAFAFAPVFLVVIPEGNLLLSLPFLSSSRTLSEVEWGRDLPPAA
jgi:hypothetical protein